MKKVTTTKKINEAITNNLLQIQKAEVYNKTSGKTETMNIDRFTENFGFLCESGIFMDTIGWHFERDCKKGNYEIEAGRLNSDVEIIVTVYLSVCEGVCRKEVEKVLSVSEEE